MRKSVFPEVKKPNFGRGDDGGKRFKGSIETSPLWWLYVLFHNMGCRLYFFLYFCTATKLGRSPQLLPIHSFSSWLNLLFDGAPDYQRLLTRSNSLIFTSLPKEWHTSLSQRVRGLKIIIWKKIKHLWKTNMKEEITTPFILLLFLKNNLQEEKQVLFFFHLSNCYSCTHPVHWNTLYLDILPKCILKSQRVQASCLLLESIIIKNLCWDMTLVYSLK